MTKKLPKCDRCEERAEVPYPLRPEIKADKPRCSVDFCCKGCLDKTYEEGYNDGYEAAENDLRP